MTKTKTNEQRKTHLSDHNASFALAQSPLLHHVVEQLPTLHDLHHHVNLRLGLENVLHVDNIRMPQQLQHLRVENEGRGGQNTERRSLVAPPTL